MREVLGHVVLTLLLGCCASPYQGPASDHFDGRRFFNPGKPMDKSFGSFVKWRMTDKPQYWPEYREIPAYDKPSERVFGDDFNIALMCGIPAAQWLRRDLGIWLDLYFSFLY